MLFTSLVFLILEYRYHLFLTCSHRWTTAQLTVWAPESFGIFSLQSFKFTGKPVVPSSFRNNDANKNGSIQSYRDYMFPDHIWSPDASVPLELPLYPCFFQVGWKLRTLLPGLDLSPAWLLASTTSTTTANEAFSCRTTHEDMVFLRIFGCLTFSGLPVPHLLALHITVAQPQEQASSFRPSP